MVVVDGPVCEAVESLELGRWDVAEDAVGAHQPLDPIAADIVDPVALERQVQLAVAVGLEVGLVNRADRDHQLVVANRPLRTPAAGALVGGRCCLGCDLPRVTARFGRLMPGDRLGGL